MTVKQFDQSRSMMRTACTKKTKVSDGNNLICLLIIINYYLSIKLKKKNYPDDVNAMFGGAFPDDNKNAKVNMFSQCFSFNSAFPIISSDKKTFCL